METSCALLIVDDDASWRGALVSLLSRAGYSCVAASSAAETKEKLREYPIRLVVADMLLGEDVGGTLLARWIADNCYGVKVILYSGYPVQMARALNSRANHAVIDVLDKNKILANLIALVEQTLSSSPP